MTRCRRKSKRDSSESYFNLEVQSCIVYLESRVCLSVEMEWADECGSVNNITLASELTAGLVGN